MPSRFLSRTLALSALALLATGCVSTGDPYYEPAPYHRGYEPGVIYPSGAYPVYPVAPPPAEWRRSDRDRWERENRIYERDRERWEKERDRARWEREREQNAARDRERREQNARHDREAREREIREREEARRQQAESDRRNRLGPDGKPRRDFDRYNPRSGQWLPRQEDMP